MEKVSKEYFYNFGYNCFGSFLLEFSKWLDKNLKELNIDKVFFLSRDGYIFKEAFDIIKEDKIRTKYMYASRRSICVPALYKVKKIDEVIALIKLPKEFTINDFLKKIGLDNSMVIKKLSSIGIDCSKSIKNYKLSSNETIKIVYENIKDELIENSCKEYKNLVKYLKDIGFENEVSIVDIGWYGSMQKSLQIINPKIKIFGLYVGINADSSYVKQYNGFLFDKNNRKNIELINSFRQMFEFLTLANHGSVKKFDGSKDVVELYPYEYTDTSLEIIKTIQKGAIDYVKKHKDHESFDFKKFSNFFIKPKLKDVKFFGKIPFYDSRVDYMANPKSIFYYLFHPKKLTLDFKNCGWKIGFMKKLFKIPLPYYRINLILRKKYAVKEK